MINKNDLVSFINNAMKGNRCEPENDSFCDDGQSCDIAYSPGICVPKDDADKMSKYPEIKFFDIRGNNIHGPQSSITRMTQLREKNFPEEEEKYPESDDEQVITDINPFASSPQQPQVSPQQPQVSPQQPQVSPQQPQVSPQQPQVSPQQPQVSPQQPQVSPQPQALISPSDVSSILSQLQKDSISSIDELSEASKQVLKCLSLLG